MAAPVKIPYAQPSFFGTEETYLVEAFRSTWISGGTFVDRFEEDFRRYCGSRFAVTASNGTTALHMAYLALGIKAGDEVIVPGFGFLAAANIALHAGARAVCAEVDPDTWCMTAREIERCLSPRTRLIVAVHTYGNVCEMDDILALAHHHRIAVLEDAAEAFPSRYRGRLAGTMGVIGTYSFQATKTITTGEGGMVVTDDPRLHEGMSLYRNHGMRSRRYWHEVAGHNFRLTNLQAAIGCAQLERLEQIVGERKRVSALYADRLANAPGITPQRVLPDVDTVFWSCAVRLDPRAFPQGRDAVVAQLAETGIETRPGFYAASMLALYETPALPVCEAISRQVVSLPTYPSLSDEHVALVCDRLSALRK
jgi:perosamine synthetase